MNACDPKRFGEGGNVKILRFQPDKPIEVALACPRGTIVEGRYGDRMMFHLTDGRVMYVPPIVAGKIEAQGINVGERFELCRALVKTARGRTVEWRVTRTDGSPPQEGDIPETRNDAEVETELESQLRRSLEIVAGNAPDQPSRGRIQAVPAPAAHSNGKGAASGPNPDCPSVPPTKLEHALRTAIAAAHNAEKFGADLGYVVRFDADAIKSMAITVLINMREERQ
jgi:hypothetical protein